ncbi:DUF5309 domain-containing protein [Patescibacteria group bacterium]|nr:DUF5309 domain-containing protein [Patescibacteria group bacterium]MBU4353372.1 DUF5309 domain-containing protein [Patescibacteria group bacterium]MBU4477451.1 DUF5309 domain-containing protein [Patescibacteria group bacterium]MCG2699118.1 DUF5309 domain-containing protein [Candidatus Parcubacteria bacterium]
MGRIITTDVREREDLSDVIDVLLLKDDDMKFLSFVNFLPKISDLFGKKVTAQKHEWIDDAARAESITSGASGAGVLWDAVGATADLTIAAADTGKLRVGDVLLLGNLLEVVVVKSINAAANTIVVYGRGHGSTDGAAQGQPAFNIKILGNAQAENSDPIDSNATTETPRFNYTQIFEDVAAVSGTIRRSGMPGGDRQDFQVVKKLKELLRSLNYALIEGIRDLDTTNKVGTMGGLRELFANTSNVAGTLSVAKFYTALVAHVNAGLYPSAIHASPTVIAIIEQLFNTVVRTKPADKVGGQSITVINAMGYEIQLHIDRHVRSTEFLIVDYNRCAYGELNGGDHESGAFAQYPLYDKRNGKQWATQVLGEYVARVSNGGGTRAYGITG